MSITFGKHSTTVCSIAALCAAASPAARADIPLSKLSQVNAAVYGRVDMSVEKTSATGQPAAGTADQFSRLRVNSNTSFAGIRGNVSITDDVSVFGQLEVAFRPDNGATTQGTIGSRQNGLAVDSKAYGRLLVGQWDSPYKVARFGNNPWDAWSLEGPNVLLDNGTVAGVDSSDNNYSFGRRIKNTVQYWSPSLAGGTQLRFATEGNETRDASKNPRLYSVAVLSNYGPLRVTFAHERHVDYQVAGKSDKGYRGLVSYDFQVASVALFIDRTTYNLAAGSLSRTAGSLGVAVPYGPGAFKFNYALAKDGKGSAPVGTKVGAYVLGADTGASSWAAGYDWRLNNEFSVYGYLTQLKNKAGGAYDWDVNALGIGGANRGLTSRALVLGAKYQF